ncbi:MAG: ABC transporter substrate-binding protein [Rhizobiaceae bacterium]|nr:ABC transporter substrate-binding protein [Rhizobiaceae bacterium]
MRAAAWLSAIMMVALGVSAPGTYAQDKPQARRVVSMNLCTDQLALLIAAPGQLHSVSWLAADPQSSALADEARGFALNHGLAEEIFLMQPDLVIAGTYTARSTVELLRKLGIRVEEFAPDSSLEDIRQNIARMGEILGQQQRADALGAAFDSAIANSKATKLSGKQAATYYPNSYTSGAGTLVDSIISASGLENTAAKLGFSGTAKLPLEVLLLSAPDVVINDREQPASPALAHENFTHPAYRHLAANSANAAIPAKYTICGGPFTADAIRLLRDAAEKAPL